MEPVSPHPLRCEGHVVVESGDMCRVELARGRCWVSIGSCNAHFSRFQSCGPTAPTPPDPAFGRRRPRHRLVAKSSM
eukprot:7235602-Prymnesium_polylepis.1